MPPSQSSADDEIVLFEGRPAVIAGLGDLLLTILTVGLAALYFWAKARSALSGRLSLSRKV